MKRIDMEVRKGRTFSHKPLFICAGRCGCRRLLADPGANAERIDGDAEQVCWDKAELGCAQSDYADDRAVDSGRHEANPELSSEQNCRENGEATRKIVQVEHGRFEPP